MKRIVVLGGSGLVGSRFIELNNFKFEIISPSHQELDIVNSQAVSQFMDNTRPESLINFAGFTNVDEAEKDKDSLLGNCYKLNVLAAGNLAKICAERKIHLIHISTDYVFDGQTELPYKEDAIPNPLNWYGMTKKLGEDEVKALNAEYTITRIEMPYSARHEKKLDLARTFLKLLKEGKEINATDDQAISPTFVDTIAQALESLINKKALGIYHLSSTDSTTPFDFANLIAEKFELDKNLIKPVKFEDYNKTRPAKRPQNTFLDTSKFQNEFGGILKSLSESLDEFKKQIVD